MSHFSGLNAHCPTNSAFNEGRSAWADQGVGLRKLVRKAELADNGRQLEITRDLASYSMHSLLPKELKVSRSNAA